jgi:nitroreductase
METLSTNALLARLHWRYATKKFDPAKKIHPSLWSALEEALVLSPSSYGLQPYHFLVINDPEIRKTLRVASWDQSQVTDASHFVVFARKLSITAADIENFVGLIASTRSAERGSLQGYYEMMVGDLVSGPRSAWIKEWTARQTYLALGNLLTSAALLGVDACPMEGFDPAKYDEILGLPAKGLGATSACPLGYRAEDDKYANAKKVRFPSDELIEHR